MQILQWKILLVLAREYKAHKISRWPGDKQMTNWEYYNMAYGNGNIPMEKAIKLFLENDCANWCFICPARKFCGECDLGCYHSFIAWAKAEHAAKTKKCAIKHKVTKKE